LFPLSSFLMEEKLGKGVDTCSPLVHTVPQMSTEPLAAELKTRLQPSMKRALELIADRRHLDTADIVREALRLYLEQQAVIVPTLPCPAEKAEVVA